MNRIWLFFSLLFLASCSTIMDKSMQEVSFETPGARDSMCIIDTGELSYKVYPPETTMLMKTSEELIIECYADGNRHKKLVIEPVLSSNTLLNLGNGFVPGFTIDEHTRSHYIYPDKIAVDFSNIPFEKAAQPAYAENPMAPAVQDIDPIHSGMPALSNQDMQQHPTPDKRQSRAYLTDNPDSSYYAPSSPAPIK